MKLSSSKNSALLLLVALIAALLFALYYYVVLPKKDEVESLQSSVNYLQTEIATLQENLATGDQQGASTGTNFAMRKKLPQTREIDRLLLNIEEIEYISDSRVLAVDFNSYDELVSESNIAPTPEGQTPTEGSETVVDPEAALENSGTPDAPVSSISQESLPPELKLITFNIEVESTNYEKLQLFIKEIELLERIMHIDTISFSLPGEENEFAEDATDVVSASIQVTTFYYEGES